MKIQGSSPITYRPNTAGIDTGRYNVTGILVDEFRGDVVLESDIDDLAALAASESWEDRIRAEVLRNRLTITLPDQFPCLYETPDSRRRTDHRPHPWVASPDMDMLVELLPDYQELWDRYTARRGLSHRRIFAVGRLDGIPPYRLYRPGVTAANVIGHAMLEVPEMYHTAPERLRAMSLRGSAK